MFFSQLEKHQTSLAVVDQQESFTYSQLAKCCDDFYQHIRPSSSIQQKKLYVLKCGNDVGSLIAYLTVLRAGHSAIIINRHSSKNTLQHLVNTFEPEAIIDGKNWQYPDIDFAATTSGSLKIHTDLAILLSTSGSTGSAKHVALSYENLNQNAVSICQYLPIQIKDKTLCSLPMFYSYGLSVINSHLSKGACCVLTEASPMNREYWQILEDEKINSIAGVPYTYEILLRLRLTNKALPHLRYFTQAGGKLDKDKVLSLANYASEQDKQFFIMYGQTEATARMSYLNPANCLNKPNSIGRAIPGGQFSLVDEKGKKIDSAHNKGELVYSGANVMMGYVSLSRDLAFQKGKQENLLYTGDIGYFDEEGDFYITGRKSRFLKLFGNRVSLDRLEQMMLEQGVNVYACGNDQGLVLAVDKKSSDEVIEEQPLKSKLSKMLAIHHSAIHVMLLDELPINDNGKKDYQSVMQSFKTIGH